jgi:hypothetical protein
MCLSPIPYSRSASKADAQALADSLEELDLSTMVSISRNACWKVSLGPGWW